MTLTKSDFNAKAARQIHDLVMKMDDDSAEMFAFIVMSDVIEADIEKNLVTYQKRLDQVVAKRIDQIKKSVLRTVSKANAEEAAAFAAALRELEDISKAQNAYDYGYRFKETDFNRDASTGRFRTKIKHNEAAKPMDRRTADAMGIRGTKDEAYQKLPAKKKALYQQEYAQLSQFLAAVQASTKSPGDTSVILQFQDKSGQRYDEIHTGTRPPKEKLLDPDTRLVGAVARPEALTLGGAAYNLSGSLGAGGQRSLNALDDNFGSFAAGWDSPGDEMNSNAQRYNRIKASSTLLGQMTPGMPKAQTAARLGEFVGAHGAEAEKVIGPSARKTAYRYRGTEKTPDAEMVAAYAQAINAAKSRTSAEQNAGRDGRRSTMLAPQQMAAQRIMNERRDPSFDEVRAGSEAIVSHLSRKMPSRKLYQLQLASGNTPPSEGVMLNDKGQIVAQASGYGDDHYLPFNLKNLKGLKNGEYIRTRSVGGLTSEDIYTGLVSGARRVTVVSRSGTFTVTFEDDFRGGRRHNDKARRMTRRYEQILDAVQSKDVDRQPVPEDVRQLITQEVRQEAGDWGASRVEQAKQITDRIEEYKRNPGVLTTEDDKIIEMRMRSALAGETDERKARAIRAQFEGARLAEKEFKYRLNGPGYEAALQALEEQFPYYIKVDAKPTHDLDNFNGTEDRGYVEPGRNRPTLAQAGLYGTKVNQGRKFSASQADYQGARAKQRGGTPDSPASEARREDPVKEEPSVADRGQEVKRKIALNNAAASLQTELKGKAMTGLAPEYQRVLDAEPASLREPGNLDKLRKLADLYVERGGKIDQETYRGFLKASGDMDRQPFDRKALVWGSRPNSFPKEAAYASDADQATRLAELRKQDAFSVRGEKRFSAMTDDEMEAEFSVLAGFHEELAHGPLGAATKRNLGASRGARGLQGLDNQAAVEGRMEKLQRSRALMADMSPQERESAGSALDAGTIILTEQVQTPETRGMDGGPDAAVDSLIKAGERAARQFENSDNPLDEEKSNEIRLFVNGLHDNRRDFRTQEDVARVTRENADVMRLIYRQDPK